MQPIMANGNGGDHLFDYLHLLLIPFGIILGWIMRQLGLKADKADVKDAIERLTKAIDMQHQERIQMHEENTRRMDRLQEILLNVVGGRYNNER